MEQTKQAEQLEQLKKVFSDQAYVESLLKLDNAEEVQRNLKEEGVELSIQDIERICKMVQEIESGEISPEIVEKIKNNELTDEQLDQISGGVLTEIAVGFIVTWVLLAAGTLGVGSAHVDNRMRAQGRRW